MALASPQRLTFGGFLIALIIAAELVIEALHLPAWPAFMVMVFFFVEHMNPKKAPEILVGGCFGIACILLAQPIISLLTPVVGAELGRLVFIVVVVYAIVALGESLPLLFNNYAFMFLTVSALAVTTPNPNPYVWMAVQLLGGGLLIGGVLGIGKVMASFSPAAAHAK